MPEQEGAAVRQSIVAPDVSYAITDRSDPLYDEDMDVPFINERFEREMVAGTHSLIFSSA